MAWEKLLAAVCVGSRASEHAAPQSAKLFMPGLRRRATYRPDPNGFRGIYAVRTVAAEDWVRMGLALELVTSSSSHDPGSGKVPGGPKPLTNRGKIGENQQDGYSPRMRLLSLQQRLLLYGVLLSWVSL
jgi:hypothetical protein